MINIQLFKLLKLNHTQTFYQIGLWLHLVVLLPVTTNPSSGHGWCTIFLSLVHGAWENFWLGRNKARSGAMLFQETLKWIQSHVINAKEALISQRLLKKVSIFRANGLVTTYWCTNIWPYQSRMSPKWFPSKTSLSVNCSFLS